MLIQPDRAPDQATEQRTGSDAAQPNAMVLDPGGSAGADPAAGEMEFTSGDLLPLLLAGFGFAVLTFTLLRMYRRRVASQHDRFTESPAERIASVRESARQARSPLEELMADATDLVTQLSVQLDSKAAYLEQLLDRAERVAERLERAEQQGHVEPEIPVPAERQRPTHAGVGDRPTQRNMRLEGDSPDPMHSQIYALADEGLDTLAIAQKLGQPKGQVELVLKLRRA